MLDFFSKKEYDPMMYLWLAKEHYNNVKIIFDRRAHKSAFMIVQQSFELYIKWILLINGLKFRPTHNLIENLKIWKSKIDIFKNILEDKKYYNLLDTLWGNLMNIRYPAYGVMRIDDDIIDVMDSLEIIFVIIAIESFSCANLVYFRIFKRDKCEYNRLYIISRSCDYISCQYSNSFCFLLWVYLWKNYITCFI